jgi:hypothetical protein
MRIRFFFIIFFALVSGSVFAQISVRYYGAKKSFYHPNDTVRMSVLLRLNPKSCLDGMKKTYLYFSGCEDILRAQWVKRPNNIFQKDVLLKINEKAGRAKMTVIRNTDKESYFRQETLTIK